MKALEHETKILHSPVIEIYTIVFQKQCLNPREKYLQNTSMFTNNVEQTQRPDMWWPVKLCNLRNFKNLNEQEHWDGLTYFKQSITKSSIMPAMSMVWHAIRSVVPQAGAERQANEEFAK